MTNEAAAGESALESAGHAPLDPPDGESNRKNPWKRRITLAGGAAVLVAAAVVVPPLIGIGRYQRQVTSMMSRAMGRPVRLSSVELRLLPRPGFVLHDLSVSEDPAFGAEPVLSARTVVASVALFSLWNGKPRIDRVSVDEASLNLVRNAQGRWNLESLMMGGTEGTVSAGKAAGPTPAARLISASFPYLEATNSRVNFKKGVEKTPFSLVDSDLSLWQDEPGAWRVRLRGQPARTDMEMSLGDTGEVRLEASFRSAARLREMPLKLQVEWRDAQLGQLSRLLTGSDAGWRGAVTADIDLLGSPESAQTTARLRAVQVRREEFAPDTPLDFDANCSFRFQHSANAFHNLSCDTAIGNGLLHLKAELPGTAGPPEGMLEVKEVPLQAGLDLLRTVRSGFAPGISARGSANGSLSYKVVAPAEVPVRAKASHARGSAMKRSATGSGENAEPSPFTGTITIDQAMLRGGGLKEPLTLPAIVLTPAVDPAPSSVQPSWPASRATQATTLVGGERAGSGVRLTTKFTIALPSEAPKPPAPQGRPHPNSSAPPASNLPNSAPTVASPPASPDKPSSINVTVNLKANGFAANVTGTASVSSLRDLAYAAGAPHLDAVNQLATGTADVALSASGPWIPSDFAVPVQTTPTGIAAKVPSPTPYSEGEDRLSGSLQLHRAQWRPPYLGKAVDLPQGTVSLTDGNVAWNTEFSFGPVKDPVKGTADGTIDLADAANCSSVECLPKVALHFGSLDGAALQAALLSVPEKKTLLSPILDEVDRMRSSGAAKWPEANVTVQADTLTLGVATLRKVSVEMHMSAAEIAIVAWQADALGGTASGTGHFAWTSDKPEYQVEGTFSRLNPAQVGAKFESRWSGGALSGTGRVELSGLSAKDLAASAAGELAFDWLHGALGSSAAGVPPHFDDWSGSAAIRNGSLDIGKNLLTAGKKMTSLAGTIPFGGPVKLSLTPDSSGPATPTAPKP